MAARVPVRWWECPTAHPSQPSRLLRGTIKIRQRTAEQTPVQRFSPSLNGSGSGEQLRVVGGVAIEQSQPGRLAEQVKLNVHVPAECAELSR